MIKTWNRVAEIVAALFFAIMFAAFLLQVVSRYVFNQPIGWTFEVCVAAYIWIVFWSCAFLLKERDHVAFNMFYLAARPPAQRLMLLIGFGCVFAAFLGSLPMTFDFVTFMAIDRTPLLRVRFDWIYAVYILFMLAVTYRSGRMLLRLAGSRWRDAVEKGGGSESFL